MPNTASAAVDLGLLRRTGLAAVTASMEVIRPFQTGERLPTDVELKQHDGSLRSVVDWLSEQAATAMLVAGLPEVPLQREEGGWSHGGPGDADIICTVDPLDGTRPFLNGASGSTVIITFYSRRRQRIVMTFIGEPATGRIWTAAADGGCTMSFVRRDGGRDGRPCRVWDVPYGPSTTVLIDNFAGFTRLQGTREVLTDAGICHLFGTLQSQVAIQNYGSNGLHHVLVALGRQQGVVGAITTAIGGEWDCGGVLAVLEAGGVARGFEIGYTVDERFLMDRDPLDPTQYDLVAVANNHATLDLLSAALAQSIRR